MELYESETGSTQSFIEKTVSDWGVTMSNKLHCLLLTNKLVAEYNGFKELYDLVAGCQYYKTNFKQINTELLSSDVEKLGRGPSALFTFARMISVFQARSTPLSILLRTGAGLNATFEEIRSVINEFRSVSGNSMRAHIVSILQKAESRRPSVLATIVDGFLNPEWGSFDSLHRFLVDELFPNSDDEDIASAKTVIDQILDLDIRVYRNWVEFLEGTQKSDVLYHTYHGTKGEEYDNVLVVMQNDFGTSKNEFSNFFMSRIRPELQPPETDESLSKTANLLYVSCSRAIKRLRILYLDDVTEFRSAIEGIFGKAEQYSPNSPTPGDLVQRDFHAERPNQL